MKSTETSLSSSPRHVEAPEIVSDVGVMPGKSGISINRSMVGAELTLTKDGKGTAIRLTPLDCLKLADFLIEGAYADFKRFLSDGVKRGFQ